MKTEYRAKRAVTDAWGIDSGYEDATRQWHNTPAETRKAILIAMGADRQRSRDAGRVHLLRSGRPIDLGRGTLMLEDGTRQTVERRATDLPIGYHRFQPADGSSSTLLIATPGECILPVADRIWGWAAQLYAARSKESWGIGDLADLRRIAEWSAKLSAGLLLINPLHAVAPLLPQQSSPYYPSSRCFRNPLYLRVEEVPGANSMGEKLAKLSAAGRALNDQRKIDRNAIFKLKEDALQAIWEHSARDAGFTKFRGEQGQPLQQFAIYCALTEQHGGDWRAWPADFRRPDGSAVARFAEQSARRVLYHQWLQWQLDQQLARAATALPIMQDLPIGIDPGGADAWAWQDQLAEGCSVGAPPDVYNSQGQDWGLPPFIPHKLRAAGYSPFIQTIRASMRHAGGLRIDHVMGLFRLFWIPHGFGPRRGTYVRYRPDELLAIVAIESHRAGAFVVGEDLGTVEPGVREQLAAHRMLSYRVLWFEDDLPPTYPELSMVAATTHDLPTVAGLWSGSDLAAQQELGLQPSVESTNQIRDRLKKAANLSDSATTEQVVEGAYRALGQAPSRVITATLEDALAVPERPNMPATVDQWPNWSLALPGGVEALEKSQLAGKIAKALGGRKRPSGDVK